MEIGVAGSIGTKQFSGGFVDKNINKWLEENADVEVIDIKFTAVGNDEELATDALIIYRKES